MTDIQQGSTNSRSGRNPWSHAPLSYGLWAGVLIGVAVVLYIIVTLLNSGGHAGLRSLARGQMAKLTVAENGPAEPATPFLDPQGRQIHLSDLKAPVLVVNLWATWCAPCVKEMPTLARLQGAYAGKITVAPISMDGAKDRDKARAFIGEHAPLAFYQDANLALPFAVKPAVEGFPTTIIYGRDGREKARLTGPADWDGPDAKAVIDAVLAQP
jgi:thiol-disulfide isomerase/thioredoxin